MTNHEMPKISVCWAFLVKQTDKGSKPKARLVTRGFEEDSLNTFDKESTTINSDTLRKCYQPLMPLTGISSQ